MHTIYLLILVACLIAMAIVITNKRMRVRAHRTRISLAAGIAAVGTLSAVLYGLTSR